MIRKSFPSAIEQTDSRTFVATVSTGALDRDGDRIDPQGWQLDAYRQNNIVLFNHDRTRPPIARATDIAVKGGKLMATMEFPPPNISPLADEIHGLTKAGFLHSTSVGFLALKSVPNGMGRDIHEAELMEFSIVNIPSQVEARISRCMGEACNEGKLKSWLGHSWQHHEEDIMKYLDIDDGREGLYTKDPVGEAFDEMCAQMLSAYSEFDSDKFRELMRVQLATLGPLGSIADLVRGIMRDGVTAPKYYDVDERELATTIAHVVASEMGAQTRAAFNQVLGRLD